MRGDVKPEGRGSLRVNTLRNFSSVAQHNR